MKDEIFLIITLTVIITLGVSNLIYILLTLRRTSNETKLRLDKLEKEIESLVRIETSLYQRGKDKPKGVDDR